MKRTLLILCLLVSVVACDQITKAVARNRIEDHKIIEVFGRFVILTHVENNGAFLGLGSNWPAPVRAAIFGVLSGVIVVVAIVYLFHDRRMKTIPTIAFSFIAAGGIGNMIDRIAFGGRVTDFLNIGVGKIRTGVFNAADLFLMIGLVLYIVTGFRSERKPRDDDSIPSLDPEHDATTPDRRHLDRGE